MPFEQKKQIRRLNWPNLGGEISDALNINKGFVYTWIGLTLRPAETIRAYLQEGRHRVLNPAKYFLLVLGIFLFVASNQGYFDMQDFVAFEIDDEATQEAERLTDFGHAFQTYFVKYFSVWSLAFIALLTVILKKMFSKRWLTAGFRTLTALSVAVVLMSILVLGLILLYLASQMTPGSPGFLFP